MAVTVLSSAFLSSGYQLFDTGSAVYVVGLDDSTTPRVRVLKGDAYPQPSSFSEQDSANNKAGLNSTFRDVTAQIKGSMLHIIVATATNTLTHYRFDTSTDLWTTGFGTVTTDRWALTRIYPYRIGVRSDDDVVVLFKPSSGGFPRMLATRYEGSSWATTSLLTTGSDTSANRGAYGLDLVMDSTDRAAMFYTDSTENDQEYRTYDGSNTLSAEVDLDAAIFDVSGDQPSRPFAVRYTPYDDAGTEKVIAAFIAAGLIIAEREVSLEADAASGNLATQATIEGTAGDLRVGGSLSTFVYNGVPYCVWDDEGSSGTVRYSTKSGGSWAAHSDWGTSQGTLIEAVPVGGGVALLLNQSGNLVLDWFINPPQTYSRTITPVAAAIKVSDIARNVQQRAAIKVLDRTRTVTPVRAAIAVVNQARTITPVRAAIRTTNTRTVTPVRAAIKVTDRTRTITPVRAAIKVTDRTRTVPQSAAIRLTFSRTVTPVRAAIRVTVPKTVPQAARISTPGLTRTVQQRAAIRVQRSQVIPQSAAIKVLGLTRTVTPIRAAIRVTSTRTVSQAARISTPGLVRTITPVRAAIRVTSSRVVPQVARISVSNRTRSVPQSAAIKVLDRTRTVTPVRAAIRVTASRSVPQAAHIITEVTWSNVIPQSAAIAHTFSRTVPQAARVSVANIARTVTQRAAIRVQRSQVVPQAAAIRTTTARVVPQAAAIRVTISRPVPQSAAIKVLNLTRSVPQSATVRVQRQQTIPQAAAIRVTAARVVPQAARVSVSNLTRTVQQRAHIAVLNQVRTVTPVRAAIKTLDHARIVSPVRAAILTVHTRTIPQSAALLVAGVRTIPQAARITTANLQRVVPQAVAVSVQRSQVIPQSGSIAVLGLSRTLSQRAAILTIHVRTIPQSAALLVSVSRSVPQAAAVYNVQEAVPVSDVANDGWTTDTGSAVNLFATLDEPVPPDDADYIQSPPNPGTPRAVTLQLTALSEPSTSGPHIITYRYARDVSGGPGLQLVARLYEGAVLIAEDDPVTPTTSFVDREWLLDSGEVAAITDYADLRIEFEAEAV